MRVPSVYGPIGFTVLSLGVLVVSAAAAEPAGTKPAKPSTSLDDELFKDLDDGTGKPKEAAKPVPAPKSDGRTKPAAEPAKSEPLRREPKPSEPTRVDPAKAESRAGSPPRPSNPLDAELLKGLDDGEPEKKPKSQPKSQAGGGADDDPLSRLGRRIREAESRIRRSESGAETQELQRDIVEDLEKLIAQIERRRQKSRSRPGEGNGKPGAKPGDANQPGQRKGNGAGDDQPARDSDDGLRNMAAKKADPGRLKNMLEQVWGMLPERERQDVMQSSVDDFPAKYQYVIEEYFRTLLERRE
jgi:hypothetical protein